MKSPRGTALFLLAALLGFSFIIIGRAALHREGPPAFFVEKREGICLGVGEGFSRKGIHQFPDGTTLRSVIEMTSLLPDGFVGGKAALDTPLQDGEHLELVCFGGKINEIRRGWLPAGQRVALGIPLHPDRMSREDWEFLPGLGPRLAEAIEEDRQINDDFGSLQALGRVRGVGPKRLESWQEFFY